MCVIFDVAKDNSVPFDKFVKPACLRNKDGWGIVFVDRGKLQVQRFFDPNGYDPEDVMKKLEETKQFDRMLHVRFTTRGAKTLDNVHPFEILSQSQFGTGIQLMHNGTFQGWGDTEISDSHDFSLNLVKPLTETYFRGGKTTELFDDPIYQKILKEFVPNSSIVTLINSDNKKLIIDKGNSGKKYDGFWASNDWYFEKERSTYNSSTPFHQGQTNYWSNHSAKKNENASSVSEEKTNVVPLVTNDNSITSFVSDILKLNETYPVVVQPNQRETFCKLAGISDFDKLRFFGPDEISALIEEYPDEASILIQDLLFVYTSYKDIAMSRKN